MSKHTPEPWVQGCLMLTNRTKMYPLKVQERYQEEEERLVLTNFHAHDEGRSRELIAICQTKEDAARMVLCVNACAGMEDPQAEIAKLKEDHARMLEFIRVMHASTLNDPAWINTNRVLSSILKECSHG